MVGRLVVTETKGLVLCWRWFDDCITCRVASLLVRMHNLWLLLLVNIIVDLMISVRSTRSATNWFKVIDRIFENPCKENGHGKIMRVWSLLQVSLLRLKLLLKKGVLHSIEDLYIGSSAWLASTWIILLKWTLFESQTFNYCFNTTCL